MTDNNDSGQVAEKPVEQWTYDERRAAIATIDREIAQYRAEKLSEAQAAMARNSEMVRAALANGETAGAERLLAENESLQRKMSEIQRNTWKDEEVGEVLGYRERIRRSISDDVDVQGEALSKQFRGACTDYGATPEERMKAAQAVEENEQLRILPRRGIL